MKEQGSNQKISGNKRYHDTDSDEEKIITKANKNEDNRVIYTPTKYEIDCDIESSGDEVKI